MKPLWARLRHLAGAIPAPLKLAALGAAVLTVAASVAAQGPAFAVEGGYGFNWSKPRQATCREVTRRSAQDFVSCEFSKTGAFGLPLAHHACRLKGQGKGEVLVFEKKTQCQEALETMRANGP